MPGKGGTDPAGGQKSGEALERATNAVKRRTAAPAPKARAARSEPENAIQASRRVRKKRNAGSPSSLAVADPASRVAPSATAPPQGNSDPWTVPQSVRDRFVQDGHRFYFPDGAPAFKDRGRRLSTPSENTQVVQGLIQIAQSRGWTEVTVSGTERFRQEAWRQARLAGLSVRGYSPDEAERAQLIRALGRQLSGPVETIDAVSAQAASIETPAASRRTSERGTVPPERIAGRLLDHGRDAYRHDPDQQPSYFVRLQTAEGTREIWGKDIERAVARSLTQPKVGEDVILQRTGRDAVTVRRQERDDNGQSTQRPVDTYRNRWVLEKIEFFNQRAEAARVVREDSIEPRQAVRRHPELAGTYLNLRAAELAARVLRDGEDRRRFVARVREALAGDIEHGEPLQPVRLRERRTPSPQIRSDPERGEGFTR
jgi:putative DNA primase/helicase